MNAPSTVEAAATRLAEAQATGTPCEPVRDLLGAADVEQAYAVQSLMTEQRLRAGARLVGRKIGLTAPTVQRQLGVDQPDFGMLFDDMDVPLGSEIAAGSVLQPRVEAEIAFILGRDLDAPDLVSSDIILAVDCAVAAIEVVGSRIRNWDIRIADTIADNASSGAFVLGHQPRRLGDIDLVHCGMVMERAGEPVSTGAGVACMGSPLSALLWLARRMARTPYPLRRGDVVLSGALGPMVDAKAGDVFTAHIEGLGSVSAQFSA
jgi:2-keto-4-pentenoate hydratase